MRRVSDLHPRSLAERVDHDGGLGEPDHPEQPDDECQGNTHGNAHRIVGAQ